MVNNFLFENELREKANDLYVKDGQYEDVTFNTGKRQYMLSISRPGWFWSKFCNLFGLNSKFVTVAVKLEDRGCVSFEKKYGFKDKEDFDDKISQANKEIAKTLNSVLEDADKKSLLGKLNAPTAESFLEFALESPAKWKQLTDCGEGFLNAVAARLNDYAAGSFLEFALESPEKWKQLTDCGEGFFNAVAARLDDYGTKSFLKTALGSPEKWKLLTACGEGFRNAVLDRLDGHRAADFLEFALESPEKWERLTAFGKGFRNAVVDRLGDWAEFLLKYALRDDNKWKLLTTDKRLFDSLLDKLDDANASTAESLLKSALESHESREKLNACRPDFLIGLARKLDASTACDLLKYFLGWKGNLMQLTACGEGFLNAVAAKLDAPAAESFLEFALERPKKWDGEMWQRWDDSEKNFLNAVADRLDAPTAESLLQSALWNVEKWKCLISSRPLFEKLLDKLSNANASTAGRLLKSVLRDGEKWELINTLRSDFFTGLAGKLNAIAAESFLESALESPEKWKLVTACGKGFLNAVVAKLDDATAAGNLLEYALESSKKWEQLTACGPDFLIGLAGKLDGTAAGSLVELASDDGEIFDLLNACDKKFLTILVGKLGSNTNVSIVDNKLQFAAKNVGNSEPSEPKGAIDRMDHIIIADVCEKAFPYYAKDYPPYDEIYVIYKREKKLWINLTTEEQFELLREGARANWIDKVDQNYKKYQNLKKFNLTEEKIKEKMKPLMKTMVGEEINVPMEMKQHGPAHMIRASLLVPKIARTYKKLFKETQNITDKEIWFATFSAIFHDSMRQAGEIDLFDEYSAITAKKALMEMGFSKEECEACADAIRNKDSEVEGKSLIALLVHEADCLEFIRIILGNPDNFNANLLDQHGLTLQDRVTQDDVDQEIKNLISESTQFIRNTKNTTLSYEKFSEEFAKIDSTKPVTNIFALRKKYFAKFKNLGICKGSEEEKTLKSLIGKLCKSSPQMVGKIFSNCFWLSETKQVRKEFIYSVATESMRMELAEIFDQKAYNANPNGLDPKYDLLVSTTEAREDLFADKNVLDSTFRNFQKYLDSSNLPNIYSGETTNPSDINGKIWNGWVTSANLGEVRNAVEASMLNSGVKRVRLPGKNKPTNPNDISQYLLANYAFTQLILRHLRLPGHTKEFPPVLHVIRKIDKDALSKIFPGQFNNVQPGENQKKINFSHDNAFSAESYSLAGPLSGTYLERAGEAGIWGAVSAYCILTAFFANDPNKYGSVQKEVVVTPFKDFAVTAAYNFNYKDYTENVSIPIMKEQYVGNESVAREIEKVQRKVLPNAPINLT